MKHEKIVGAALPLPKPREGNEEIEEKEGDEHLFQPLINRQVPEEVQRNEQINVDGNPVQVEVELKKKRIEEAVNGIWNTMTWLLLSEIGILGALYSTPDPAKCHFWWILFVIIFTSSALCIARLGIYFHLLYKEMKNGNQATEETLWLTASKWHLYALITCTMGTLVINTLFLSFGAKLVPVCICTLQLAITLSRVLFSSFVVCLFDVDILK